MSNERLKAAMSEAGMEPEHLAEAAEVDVKTVQRWLAGRVPYSRKRIRVAKALGKDEADIWPEAVPRPATAKRLTDLQGAWARSDAEGAPNWRELITDASYKIELCDYGLIDVLETPGAPQFLQAKAAAGASVRLMIASLQGLWLTLDDWPPDTRRVLTTAGPLIETIRQSNRRLFALTANTKVEARQVLMPRCPAIRRFDDRMLVALPLWGAQRPAAPILYLHHRTEAGLFDCFCAHFEALWQTGWELEHDPEAPAPYPPSRPEQGNERQPPRRPMLAPYGRRPQRRQR